MLQLRPLIRRLGLQSMIGPLGVSAGYYLGARIGFLLQAPDAPQSVLWLPNSILLAVLLVVPFRRWPAYLIAAFPAQMLIAWRADAPAQTMALLFTTNCADAALGAFLARRISRIDGPFRFDGLRAMLIFAAFGAMLPTLLLSFADAAISVATDWSPSFRAAFVTRVRSNILTHLLVVPALIDLSALDWRQLRTPRLIEAAGLTPMVIVTCAAAFGRPAGAQALPALLYAPLPLLLWAAVRFGPGGTGWSALLVATVVSWVALRGEGSFAGQAPVAAVLSLQLFLLASATPLVFLSAVVRERNGVTAGLRQGEAALRVSYARARLLAGRLIGAQETERSRIARDMHDDFNQQLAALSISISAIRQLAPSADVELQDALRTLQARTVALTDQVRHFSHDLRPGALDHVGLTAALRTHCAQVADQHRLELSFKADADFGWIPRDVAVFIYRIVQEGLRNVVEHAESETASVSLTRSGSRLELSISDHGRGFDPAGAFARGLGLLSIEERARLAGGSLSITSGPGRGTRLDIHIPVTPAWQESDFVMQA